MKTLILFFVFAVLMFAQEYQVADVKGNAKYLAGTSEVWNNVTKGLKLNADAVISTGAKSTVKLIQNGKMFTLNEMTALPVGRIKEMTTDELLLALAMEDMINAPKSNGKNLSSSTAVYGSKEDDKKSEVQQDNYGIKRLNGALQLAKNGFEESAVVYAKETYRKYPETEKIPSYRIVFADILYEKSLYAEALNEYFEIINMNLNNDEQIIVKSRIAEIDKILLKK